MKIWKQNQEYRVYKGEYGTTIIPKHRPMIKHNTAPTRQEHKITEVTRLKEI